MEVQPPGGVAGGERVEFGRFHQHGGGGRRDLRGRPAHHAGDGHRVPRVGDDAHPRLQGVGLVVDGLDRLAGARRADDDLRPAELVVVEGVQRLAALHEHVVGDVYDVVDRRQAHGRQPVDEPPRAFLDRDAADHAGRVAGAQLRAVDPHANQLAHRRGPFRRPRGRGLHRLVGQDRDLPRHPEMAQTIRPIAGHLEVDGQVVAHHGAGFVVQPGHHQPPHDLLGRQGQGQVLRQPVPGDDHGG